MGRGRQGVGSELYCKSRGVVGEVLDGCGWAMERCCGRSSIEESLLVSGSSVCIGEEGPVGNGRVGGGPSHVIYVANK